MGGEGSGGVCEEGVLAAHGMADRGPFDSRVPEAATMWVDISGASSSVPTGDGCVFRMYPVLNRRAIIRGPFGTDSLHPSFGVRANVGQRQHRKEDDYQSQGGSCDGLSVFGQN